MDSSVHRSCDTPEQALCQWPGVLTSPSVAHTCAAHHYRSQAASYHIPHALNEILYGVSVPVLILVSVTVPCPFLFPFTFPSFSVLFPFPLPFLSHSAPLPRPIPILVPVPVPFPSLSPSLSLPLPLSRSRSHSCCRSLPRLTPSHPLRGMFYCLRAAKCCHDSTDLDWPLRVRWLLHWHLVYRPELCICCLMVEPPMFTWRLILVLFRQPN